MSEYRFTPQAVDDLFEIWSYVAGDSLDGANRVEEAVHSTWAFLADSPHAGRIREDLTALPLRFWRCSPFGIAGSSTTQSRRRCKSFASFIHPARNIADVLS